MKRYFYRGAKVLTTAKALFAEKKEFRVEDYKKYQELELVVQDDGRFSVWGNYQEDSDLLQDTRKDPLGLIGKIIRQADEVIDDSEDDEEEL